MIVPAPNIGAFIRKDLLSGPVSSTTTLPSNRNASLEGGSLLGAVESHGHSHDLRQYDHLAMTLPARWLSVRRTLMQMHRADFGARVGGGTTGAIYTVRVRYKVTRADGLTAWLDDCMTELLASN
jgi:hypothetical protein